MAQWIRICLPMKGAWVQSLVGEDPMCCRATKPVCHNYRAQILEPQPANSNYEARMPRLLKPTRPRACGVHQEKPLHEKPAHCNYRVAPTTREKSSGEDSAQPKINNKWARSIPALRDTQALGGRGHGHGNIRALQVLSRNHVLWE